MTNNRHSLVPRSKSLVALRHSLGWTQEEAAHRAGYSERLIRKLEQGGAVRPSTLNDILTSYHEGLNQTDWSVADFVESHDEEASTEMHVSPDLAAEQLVASYFDVVFNQRQTHRIPEFISEDFKLTAEGRTEVGRQVIEQRADTLLSAFSPIVHEMAEITSQGCKVFCRWSVSMKHVGEFSAIPPTHKWVTAQGQSSVYVVNDLIVETHDHWDIDHVIRQLRGEEPLVI